MEQELQSRFPLHSHFHGVPERPAGFRKTLKNSRKAGKPLVKVVALTAPEAGQTKRLVFLAGQVAVPDDFDRIGRAEIERLFGDAA